MKLHVLKGCPYCTRVLFAIEACRIEVEIITHWDILSKYSPAVDETKFGSSSDVNRLEAATGPCVEPKRQSSDPDHRRRSDLWEWADIEIHRQAIPWNWALRKLWLRGCTYRLVAQKYLWNRWRNVRPVFETDWQICSWWSYVQI